MMLELRVVIAEDNYLSAKAYAVCWKTPARSRSWLASVMPGSARCGPATEPERCSDRFDAPIGYALLPHPEIGVVVLSQHTDESYARALFSDGSAGLAYLLKGSGR